MQEVFLVYMQVSLLVGFVIASPWVFYQLWSFVAAGLYPTEKKLVNVYMPFSIGLFLPRRRGLRIGWRCRTLSAGSSGSTSGLRSILEIRLSEWLGFGS